MRPETRQPVSAVLAAAALAVPLALPAVLAGCGGEPEPLPVPERNADGTLTTDPGYAPEESPDPRVNSYRD